MWAGTCQRIRQHMPHVRALRCAVLSSRNSQLASWRVGEIANVYIIKGRVGEIANVSTTGRVLVGKIANVSITGLLLHSSAIQKSPAVCSLWQRGEGVLGSHGARERPTQRERRRDGETQRETRRDTQRERERESKRERHTHTQRERERETEARERERNRYLGGTQQQSRSLANSLGPHSSAQAASQAASQGHMCSGTRGQPRHCSTKVLVHITCVAGCAEVDAAEHSCPSDTNPYQLAGAEVLTATPTPCQRDYVGDHESKFGPRK